MSSNVFDLLPRPLAEAVKERGFPRPTEAQEKEVKEHNGRIDAAVAGLRKQLADAQVQFGERRFTERLAKAVPGVEAGALRRVLEEREMLASTAIGDGIAIPHGKLDSVGRLLACVGRSTAGVDFESMDGRPTHIFFVLVALGAPGAPPHIGRREGCR